MHLSDHKGYHLMPLKKVLSVLYIWSLSIKAQQLKFYSPMTLSSLISMSHFFVWCCTMILYTKCFFYIKISNSNLKWQLNVPTFIWFMIVEASYPLIRSESGGSMSPPPCRSYFLQNCGKPLLPLLVSFILQCLREGSVHLTCDLIHSLTCRVEIRGWWSKIFSHLRFLKIC